MTAFHFASSQLKHEVQSLMTLLAGLEVVLRRPDKKLEPWGVGKAKATDESFYCIYAFFMRPQLTLLGGRRETINAAPCMSVCMYLMVYVCICCCISGLSVN